MKVISVAATLALAASASALELTVHKQDAHHVHVEIDGKLGFENHQIGKVAARTRLYDVETGETLFSLHETGTNTRIQYHGGDLHEHETATDKEHLLQIREGLGIGETLYEDMDRMREHPHLGWGEDISLLEHLSEHVGEQGIWGNTHPASHWLHATAMEHARFRVDKLRDAKIYAEHGPDALLGEYEFAEEPAALLSKRDEETALLEEGEFDTVTAGRRRRRRRFHVKGYKGGTKWYGDVESVSSDSSAILTHFNGFWSEEGTLFSRVGRCVGERKSNGCFGMCGAICTCWPRVCGDCAMHQGCWEHDCLCLKCDWWNPRSTWRCNKVMAHRDTCSGWRCADEYCGQSGNTNDGDCKPNRMFVYNDSHAAPVVNMGSWRDGDWKWNYHYVTPPDADLIEWLDTTSYHSAAAHVTEFPGCWDRDQDITLEGGPIEKFWVVLRRNSSYRDGCEGLDAGLPEDVATATVGGCGDDAKKCVEIATGWGGVGDDLRDESERGSYGGAGATAGGVHLCYDMPGRTLSYTPCCSPSPLDPDASPSLIAGPSFVDGVTDFACMNSRLRDEYRQCMGEIVHVRPFQWGEGLHGPCSGEPDRSFTFTGMHMGGPP